MTPSEKKFFLVQNINVGDKQNCLDQPKVFFDVKTHWTSFRTRIRNIINKRCIIHGSPRATHPSPTDQALLFQFFYFPVVDVYLHKMYHVEKFSAQLAPWRVIKVVPSISISEPNKIVESWLQRAHWRKRQFFCK